MRTRSCAAALALLLGFIALSSAQPPAAQPDKDKLAVTPSCRPTGRSSSTSPTGTTRLRRTNSRTVAPASRCLLDCADRASKERK